MKYKINKQLITENFYSLQEEMKKRQKIGQPSMTAEEKHEAILRSQNKHAGDIASSKSTAGLRKSINSNPGSDMGGVINAQEAANMKRKLSAAGY